MGDPYDRTDLGDIRQAIYNSGARPSRTDVLINEHDAIVTCRALIHGFPKPYLQKNAIQRLLSQLNVLDCDESDMLFSETWNDFDELRSAVRGLIYAVKYKQPNIQDYIDSVERLFDKHTKEETNK